MIYDDGENDDLEPGEEKKGQEGVVSRRIAKYEHLTRSRSIEKSIHENEMGEGVPYQNHQTAVYKNLKPRTNETTIEGDTGGRPDPYKKTAVIENLVIEGGGCKIAGCVDALKELEKEGVLKNVKRVAGSSAGGITAFLLGIGLTLDQIDQELNRFKFSAFKDTETPFWAEVLKAKKVGVVLASVHDASKKITNLVDMLGPVADNIPILGTVKAGAALAAKVSSQAGKVLSHLEAAEGLYALANNPNFGIYKGEEFEKWIQIMMVKRFGNANLTFREFRQLMQSDPSLKDMHFTGTNLSTREIEYFSADNPKYADLPIWQAVRITMSFPGAFEVVRLIDPVTQQEHLFADGGIKNNCPMDIFDNKKYLPEGCELTEKGTNAATLGIKVDTKAEIERTPHEIKNVMDFGKALFKAVQDDSEKVKKYENRILQLPDADVETLEFDLSAKKLAQLKGVARLTANEFYQENKGNLFVGAVKNELSYESLRKLSLVKLFSKYKEIKGRIASLEEQEQKKGEAIVSKRHYREKEKLSALLKKIQEAINAKQGKKLQLFEGPHYEEKIDKIFDRENKRSDLAKNISFDLDKDISGVSIKTGEIGSLHKADFISLVHLHVLVKEKIKKNLDLIMFYDSTMIEATEAISKLALFKDNLKEELLDNDEACDIMDKGLTELHKIHGDLIRYTKQYERANRRLNKIEFDAHCADLDRQRDIAVQNFVSKLEGLEYRDEITEKQKETLIVLFNEQVENSKHAESVVEEHISKLPAYLDECIKKFKKFVLEDAEEMKYYRNNLKSLTDRNRELEIATRGFKFAKSMDEKQRIETNASLYVYLGRLNDLAEKNYRDTYGVVNKVADLMEKHCEVASQALGFIGRMVHKGICLTLEGADKIFRSKSHDNFLNTTKKLYDYFYGAAVEARAAKDEILRRRNEYDAEIKGLPTDKELYGQLMPQRPKPSPPKGG